MSPVAYIPRTRDLYPDYPPYRWVINEDVPPWTPLKAPLSECKIALLSTGGVHTIDQEPFHSRDDTSYREIPRDVAFKDLQVTHFGYLTGDATADPNCVFPLERMRELAADGIIGELADPAYSMMGGIYSSRRVRDQLAPAIVNMLVEREVDVLLLVPA